MHLNSRECERWSYETTINYLDAVTLINRHAPVYTLGFKAPGWQISDGCYQALLERGWWVADQSYNNDRRPAGLKAYLLDEGPELRVHGHLGHLGGHNENALELIYDSLLEQFKDKEFKFIKEVL